MLAKGMKPDDYRGLMVIKTTAKTKAKQRRDALRNWKVISHSLYRK